MAQLLGHLKANLGGNSILSSLEARLLYGDTVSQRVGKGYPELHYIAATAGKKWDYLEGGFNTGITYRNIGYQGSVSRLLEDRRNAAQSFTPSASTTISISLSPRPLRLIMTICSFFKEPAILAA